MAESEARMMEWEAAHHNNLQIHNQYHMSILATNNGGGGNREVVPAGNHMARCYSMIEIGTVTETFLGESKTMHKVRIGWELPHEMRTFKEGEPEKPMAISKEYTLSMHEKATLRGDLQSWRGKAFTDEEAKAFDITALLGKPCMLNVIHKISADGSKTYANVASIAPMPKGVECPVQVNPTFEFSFSDFNAAKLESLPDFIKDKIKSSQQYAALGNVPASDDLQAMTQAESKDDMPPF
jgi:hypothetical protein